MTTKIDIQNINLGIIDVDMKPEIKPEVTTEKPCIINSKTKDSLTTREMITGSLSLIVIAWILYTIITLNITSFIFAFTAFMGVGISIKICEFLKL